MEQITSLLLQKNTKGSCSTEMPLYKVWRNTGQETWRNRKIELVIYILSKLLFTCNVQQLSVTSVTPRWCLHRIGIRDNTTGCHQNLSKDHVQTAVQTLMISGIAVTFSSGNWLIMNQQ